MAKVKAVKARAASIADSDGTDQLAVQARHFLWDESEALFGSSEESWDSSTIPARRLYKCMCGNKNAELLCELEGERPRGAAS